MTRVAPEIMSIDPTSPATGQPPSRSGPGGAATDKQQRVPLTDELSWLRARLEAWGQDDVPSVDRQGGSARLDRLATALDLSAFERDTLLLVAAVELDGEVAHLVADVGGGDPRPTFGIALQLLDGGHWDALAPNGALRRWRLVELIGAGTVATRRLRIDEDVLHHLAGLPLALSGIGEVLQRTVTVELSDGHDRLVEELAGSVGTAGRPALVRVDGSDRAAALGVAMQLAARLADAGQQGPRGASSTIPIAASALPAPGPALERLTVLVDRAVVLTGRVPVVLQSPDDRLDPAGARSLRWLLDALTAPVVIATGANVPTVLSRAAYTAEVAHPPAAERQQLWREALDRSGPTVVDESVATVADELAHHHLLGAHEIHEIVRRWRTGGVSVGGDRDDGSAAAVRLRRVTRAATTADLDLAQRLRTDVAWDDLVLPAGHIAVLEDLVRRVRHRALVHERWGFGDASHGDVGTSALFAGESGTGKTLAARAIAHELDLDLYRVDLSTTVDKYIGETEKNLSRIFDAAEAAGVVLLFDEADALFGRRGEVRDGRDRYANLEVAHLLQRMESYRGLAVLTTNLRSNVDRAFLRRLTFVVNFPFPDIEERAEIWRRAFPAAAPLDGVDPDRLAQMALTGGSIASMALSAAFAAAEDGTAITTAHLLRAARIDAAKHDRGLTDRDLAVLT